MTDAKITDEPLTAADAAKRVKCPARAVLDFKDYGTHVVVVTKAGQKLSSLDAAADKGE
ncbi:hypothetical protein J1777_05955 [Comamonas denitrificans]|uniref:Uncharacterized protein n=1 Tax=Comamonas denitrificans TaxID=117506 RepID=A0A939GY07_9BURK|nr:hypothetical protein [Comamonas denitrificans]MBO1249382.1 hypothetical protein [Comamonas denitrificans]